MTKSTRLDYLDMTKGFGMLFVLIGHLQGDTIFSLSPYFHPLCVFIFAFHMPLFFIISGILMCIKDSKSDSLSVVPLKSHIYKRFRGIMVPYYWFSFFYFLVVIYALIKGTIAYQSLLINLWYIISCYGMNVLWFLPALFFGEILFVILKNKFSTKELNIVIPIISVIAYVLAYLLTLGSYDTELAKRLHELAITIIRPFIACSWIYVGYVLHMFISEDNFIGRFIKKNDALISETSPLDKRLRIKSRFTYIILGIILLVICAFLSKVNNGVDFRSLVLRNVFFYILCSLLGAYGLILFCKGLPRLRLVAFWGTGSLIFMAVHNSETVLFYALKISMFVNQYLTHARGYICYLIILGIILIYTSVLIIIIQRFFPFILGKPLKKK